MCHWHCGQVKVLAHKCATGSRRVNSDKISIFPFLFYFLFNLGIVRSLTPLWSGERRCESRPLKIRLFPMPQKGYSVLVCLILISGPPAARWAGRVVLASSRLVLSNPDREENLGRCRAYEAVTGRDGRYHDVID